MNDECWCGRWFCSRCGQCHDCDIDDMQVEECLAKGIQPEYLALLQNDPGFRAAVMQPRTMDAGTTSGEPIQSRPLETNQSKET